MKETTRECAADLMAFLYQEMDERETREFRVHLQQCSECRDEVADLGVVRESITTWRDEALAGFVSMPVQTKPRKSALMALRQFFDLSPLWLKAATAFAMVGFFVLVGLVAWKLQTNNVPVNASKDAKYTEQDVNRIVKEALARQEEKSDGPRPETVVKVVPPKLKKAKVSAPTQFAKSRRPLSKAEREQLAADLRLLSTTDETGLQLLGDRINQ